MCIFFRLKTYLLRSKGDTALIHFIFNDWWAPGFDQLFSYFASSNYKINVSIVLKVVGIGSGLSKGDYRSDLCSIEWRVRPYASANSSPLPLIPPSMFWHLQPVPVSLLFSADMGAFFLHSSGPSAHFIGSASSIFVQWRSDVDSLQIGKHRS